MNFNDLFNAGKRMAESLGNERVQQLLDEGFIVKTDSGDYFVGRVDGNLEYRKLVSEADTRDWVRPMKLDLRGRIHDLSFPLCIPYSTLGFMGPLSGSSGNLIISADGKVRFDTFIVS